MRYFYHSEGDYLGRLNIKMENAELREQHDTCTIPEHRQRKKREKSKKAKAQPRGRTHKLLMSGVQ